MLKVFSQLMDITN